VSDSGFTTVSVDEHYTGRSTVRIEMVRTPDGGEVEREIVGHDDAVAIVPVTDDGEVVLLRQYRQALREHLLEIPAGTLDVDGESPTEAALRELAEETGYTARSLEHLVTFHNSAGWTDERTHVYLARAWPATAPRRASRRSTRRRTWSSSTSSWRRMRGRAGGRDLRREDAGGAAA
jgi:ADP-ribose pyrophosphatase YjhB (NUDIX family)